jgi:hypothetical protein
MFLGKQSDLVVFFLGKGERNMINVTRFLITFCAIGLFCTMTLHAQLQAVNPIKGVGIVVKRGTSSNARTPTESKVPLTFCWSADASATNVPSTYRIKAWRVENLQKSRPSAMGTNPPVFEHAINTKGAGANDRSSIAETDPDAIKVCTESIQQSDGMTQNYEVIHPHNGGLSSGKRSLPGNFKAVTIDDFPVCEKGSSCDYSLTIEALDANGKATTPNPAPTVFTLVKSNCCWDVKPNKKL